MSIVEAEYRLCGPCSILPPPQQGREGKDPKAQPNGGESELSANQQWICGYGSTACDHDLLQCRTVLEAPKPLHSSQMAVNGASIAGVKAGVQVS